MGEYTKRLCVVGTEKAEVGEHQEPIDLTVGVFFDGTLNSKYNHGSSGIWSDGLCVIPKNVQQTAIFHGADGSRSDLQMQGNFITQRQVLKAVPLFRTDAQRTFATSL